MRNNKIIFVFVCFVLLLLSYFGVQLYNISLSINKANRIVSEVKKQKELVESSFLQSVFLQNIIMRDTIQLVDNIVLSLKELPKRKTLVLRVFESSCSPCLRRELQNISELEKQDVSVLVIASFENKRVLKSLISEFDINSPVYNLSKEYSLFPFEVDFKDVYMFLLDETMMPKYLFFPVQNNKDLSDIYINFISGELEEKVR